jgi:hypothetical protein
MKFIVSFLLLLIGCFAMAQVPAPAPVSPVPSGIMGWVTAHGGFQGAVILLVYMANSILTGLRNAAAKYDGVNPGDAAPADASKLNLLNKVCLVLGKVLDYVLGNPQH